MALLPSELPFELGGQGPDPVSATAPAEAVPVFDGPAVGNLIEPEQGTPPAEEVPVVDGPAVGEILEYETGSAEEAVPVVDGPAVGVLIEYMRGYASESVPVRDFAPSSGVSAVGGIQNTYGERPLVAIDSYLDTGTQYVGAIGIRHPERYYEPRLLEAGPIERETSIPPGHPIVGQWMLSMDDHDDHHRNVLHQSTQIRRVLEARFGYEGGRHSLFPVLFIGEEQPARFPRSKVERRVRDFWNRWLGRQVPGQWGREEFPNLPEGRDSFFFPIHQGIFESTAENPQGQCELILCDTTTNDYAANQAATNEILAVYRKLTDDALFSLVPATEYTLVHIPTTIGGITYNLAFVRMNAAQADGALLRCDLRATIRGEFSSLAATTTSENIIGYWINFVWLLNALEPFLHRLDIPSIVATYQAYEDLGIPFAGSVTEPITFGALLAKLARNGLFKQFQTRYGQLGLSVNTASDPNRPIFSDKFDFEAFVKVRGSESSVDFTIWQPEETYNQIRYRYAFNSITKESRNGTYDNLPDQEEIGGEIVWLDVDFEWVRIAEAAQRLAAELATYYTHRTYHIEFGIPMVGYLELVEIARQIGITHDHGMGGPWANAEFEIYKVTDIVQEQRSVVRALTRPALEGFRSGAISGVEASIEFIDLGVALFDNNYAFLRSARHFPRNAFPLNTAWYAELEVANTLDVPITWKIRPEGGTESDDFPIEVPPNYTGRFREPTPFTGPEGNYLLVTPSIGGFNDTIAKRCRLMGPLRNARFAGSEVRLTSSGGSSGIDQSIGGGDIFRTTSWGTPIVGGFATGFVSCNGPRFIYRAADWQELRQIDFSVNFANASDQPDNRWTEVVLWDLDQELTGANQYPAIRAILTSQEVNIFLAPQLFRTAYAPEDLNLEDGHTYELRMRSVKDGDFNNFNSYLHTGRLFMHVNPIVAIEHHSRVSQSGRMIHPVEL